MRRLLFNIGIGLSTVLARTLNRRLPIFISWSLTNRCNLRCKYCDIPNTKLDELSTAQVLRAIDLLSKRGTKVISFTGGEPLLREDIGTIVNHAKKKGIFVKISSNGTFVKEKASEIRKADVIQLSFDGPKEIHDKQRGKGSYDKVMEAIQAARQESIEVYFTTTVTKQNIKSIIDTANMAKRMKIPTSFQPVTDAHCSKSSILGLYPEKEEFKNAMLRLAREKKRNRYILHSYKSLEYLARWPILGKKDCFAAKVTYRIASNGIISPCNRTTDKSIRNNINDNGLDEALSRNNEINDCSECLCLPALELNNAFSLSTEPILTILRLDFLK